MESIFPIYLSFYLSIFAIFIPACMAREYEAVLEPNCQDKSK